MKKELNEELIWILLIIGLTFSFYHLGFDLKSLLVDSYVIDINIHDTYFVFHFLDIIIPLFIYICFIVYLIRSVFKKFEVSIINILLIISICLVIIINFFVLDLINEISELIPYVPSTSDSNSNDGDSVFQFIFIFEIILVITLPIIAYKTGKLKSKE